jgi:hypothetical protein
MVANANSISSALAVACRRAYAPCTIEAQPNFAVLQYKSNATLCDPRESKVNLYNSKFGTHTRDRRAHWEGL